MKVAARTRTGMSWLRPQPAHPLAAALLAALLAACTSVDPTADLSPIGPGNGNARRAALAETPRAGALDPAADGIAVQFLPVIGVPEEKAGLLARALAEEARRSGVTILPSAGPSAPRRLKGYLSATADGGDTLLVYAWDVVDPSGARIGRIEGRERAQGGSADPWTGVGVEALRAIAARTMGDLRRLAAAPA